MLSEILQVTSLGLALSFLGSLPFGIINMTVAETTVRKGFRAGLWVAAGAAMVEFIQVWASLKLIDLFVHHSILEKTFNLIALFIFFILAAVYFRAARRPAVSREAKVSSFPKVPDYFRGTLISSLNVMVFPYWIFYGAYLAANGWMNLGNRDITFFAGGVMMGAFLVFLLYAGLGMLLIKRASTLMRYFNWFLVCLFLGLGIFQLWKVSSSF
ncbi:MAG: LysE family transporter [Saprospirales bacterium]|nr:LysE family transporter [Saprospirales bacterium]MBK8491733.1 LysE family transporter [Saprospirales bacterium]